MADLSGGRCPVLSTPWAYGGSLIQLPFLPREIQGEPEPAMDQ